MVRQGTMLRDGNSQSAVNYHISTQPLKSSNYTNCDSTTSLPSRFPLFSLEQVSTLLASQGIASHMIHVLQLKELQLLFAMSSRCIIIIIYTCRLLIHPPDDCFKPRFPLI